MVLFSALLLFIAVHQCHSQEGADVAAAIAAIPPVPPVPDPMLRRFFLALRNNRDDIQMLGLGFGGIAVGVQCTSALVSMVHRTWTKFELLKSESDASTLALQKELNNTQAHWAAAIDAERRLHAAQLQAVESIFKSVESKLKAEQELREAKLKAEQELREESVKRAKAEAVKDVMEMLGKEQYAQLMKRLLESNSQDCKPKSEPDSKKDD